MTQEVTQEVTQDVMQDVMKGVMYICYLQLTYIDVYLARWSLM